MTLSLLLVPPQERGTLGATDTWVKLCSNQIVSRDLITIEQASSLKFVLDDSDYVQYAYSYITRVERTAMAREETVGRIHQPLLPAAR